MAKADEETRSSFNTQPPEGGWIIGNQWITGEQGFNTQPPEGGWLSDAEYQVVKNMFQHTAARRRLVLSTIYQHLFNRVSTHSRPKAAGQFIHDEYEGSIVSTHSRPKAAGSLCPSFSVRPTSFNTQPPEGGWDFGGASVGSLGGFNTQPPEGGWIGLNINNRRNRCFNTQPPEGGWVRL